MTYTDLSPGKLFMMNDTPFIVLTAEFHRMQARKAVVRSSIRNLLTNQLLQKTFTASDKFDPAPINEVKVDFLYRDGDMLHFMDKETYEQCAASIDQLGEKSKYLTTDMDITLLLFREAPVCMTLPKKVELKVIDAPPAIKGNSVSNTFKLVTCENDIEVSVPLFIKEDDVIRINTDSNEYIERVKT